MSASRVAAARRAAGTGLNRDPRRTQRAQSLCPCLTPAKPRIAGKRQPLAARMRPRNARRVRRPAAFPRRREAAAAAAGGRPAGLGDLLRPARHRQDHAGPAAGRRHAQPFPPDQRRGQRREGTARDSRRRPTTGSRPPASGRCCSSTKSTASTRPSRTCSCPTSRRAW